MPIARITPIGGDLYHVSVMEAGYPDQGLPGGWPERPSTGPVRPGRPVDPGFGRPGWDGRPVDPGWGHPEGGGLRPDNALPGAPGSPGNELPANPPPVVAPGTVVVMVRSGDGKWHYAAIQPGSPPPRPLPEPPGVGVWPKPQPPGVDNTLPGAPVYPDQGLPPTAQPKPA